MPVYQSRSQLRHEPVQQTRRGRRALEAPLGQAHEQSTPLTLVCKPCATKHTTFSFLAVPPIRTQRQYRLRAIGIIWPCLRGLLFDPSHHRIVLYISPRRTACFGSCRSCFFCACSFRGPSSHKRQEPFQLPSFVVVCDNSQCLSFPFDRPRPQASAALLPQIVAALVAPLYYADRSWCAAHLVLSVVDQLSARDTQRLLFPVVPPGRITTLPDFCHPRPRFVPSLIPKSFFRPVFFGIFMRFSKLCPCIS